MQITNTSPISSPNCTICYVQHLNGNWYIVCRMASTSYIHKCFDYFCLNPIHVPFTHTLIRCVSALYYPVIVVVAFFFLHSIPSHRRHISILIHTGKENRYDALLFNGIELTVVGVNMSSIRLYPSVVRSM